MQDIRSRTGEVPTSYIVACLFGGLIGAIGWLFAGIISAEIMFSAPCSDLASLYEFRGELDNAAGQIVDAKVHSSGEDGDPLIRYDYRFAIGQKKFSGTSYSQDRLTKGQNVSVEFPLGRPERSRIVGMLTVPSHPGLFLVAIVFLGLILTVPLYRFVTGVSKIKLLSDGIVTLGVLAGKNRHASDDASGQYEYTFKYLSSGGQCRNIRTTWHCWEPLSGLALSDQQKK